MLGKLIKHDFVHTTKLLLPLNALVIIVTMIALLLHLIPWDAYPAATGFLGMLIFGYSAVLLGIMACSAFYPLVYYYRNLFTNQGYLTFTLPTSSWAILSSKVIVAFSWALVNLILTLGSLLLVVRPALPEGLDYRYTMEMMNIAMRENIGIGLGGFIALTIVTLLISIFYQALVGFLGITFGQMLMKNKVIGSILGYIIVYSVMQTITSLVFLPFIFSSAHQMASTHEIFVITMLISNGLALVFGVLFYFLSGIILKKKVNLD